MANAAVNDLSSIKSLLLAEIEKKQEDLSTKKIPHITWADHTRLFSSMICDLGRSLGYQVGAHANDGEWLYDVVWYESEGPFLKRLVLALETENKPGGALSQVEEVDRDFWKLVQSRATIRLWKTLLHNPTICDRHIENCKKQVRDYSQSEPGDFYIFVSSVWSDGSVRIEGWEYAP